MNPLRPDLKKGVIFSASTPKGIVLKAFLKHINWKPKRIFFIDDNSRFMKSMEKAANALGIEFIGFLYSGAYQVESTFDLNVARLQSTYLNEHGKWISEKEAKKLLIEQIPSN